MKRIILVILTLLPSALGALGQESSSRQDVSRLVAASAHIATAVDRTALKETLINLEKQSWETWKNRDEKFFQEFLSDDHVEVGFNGTATKAQIVAVVASPVCVVKSYSVDRFELTMFDANSALLTYHAAQDTTCNGAAVPSPVWVSSFYVKRGERWLNVLYQQTQAIK